MARRPLLNTADIAIEQKPNITDGADRASDVVAGDESILADKEYAERIKMGEDPIEIEIQPASEENAPTSYPAWVNGKGAEVFMNGQWLPITYLPVGIPMVVKRKYVEVLARAKTDNIKTMHDEASVAQPRNEVQRRTSAVANFNVLNDPNPRGVAWLSELRRRTG